MSGGVGPTCDITLPKEHEEPTTTPSAAVRTKQPTQTPRRRRFFTFNQLNALALIIILSSSGMVAMEDIAFVLFSTLYMYFLSKIAFPSSSSQSEPDPPVYGEKNMLLTLYISLGALIGLLVPVIYIFEGIYVGDKDGIKAAAPHVFLLASQVFMEGLSFSGGFSLPVRVFVPVCYNSVRIYTLMEWLRNEFMKDGTGSGERRWLYLGKGLAVANMVFWGFNLFGFLLPFYMPKAFKIYYGKIKDV